MPRKNALGKKQRIFAMESLKGSNAGVIAKTKGSGFEHRSSRDMKVMLPVNQAMRAKIRQLDLILEELEALAKEPWNLGEKMRNSDKIKVIELLMKYHGVLGGDAVANITQNILNVNTKEQGEDELVQALEALRTKRKAIEHNDDVKSSAS